MVKQFLGGPAFHADRPLIFRVFTRIGKIHNRPIADMHIHATTNAALATQGLDGTIFNNRVYIHGCGCLIFSSINPTLKKNKLTIQGRRDCQQELHGIWPGARERVY
jgi:hypothetical protein